MNNKVIVSIIVVLVIILGSYYCWTYCNKLQQNSVQMPASQMPATQTNNQQVPVTQNDNSNPIAPTPGSQSPKTYNVSVINFSFNPSSLSLNKGDTVIWTNNDSVPHQIKGDTLSSLSGPVMSSGQTYSYTFDGSGTFSYHCAIHPSMTANIIVK